MPRKKDGLSLYSWLRQDSVLGHIINAYEGIEPATSNPAVMRRIFLWEDEHNVYKGNAESFMAHLGVHFGRQMKRSETAALHELMRDLGESINTHRTHSQRSPDGPYAGNFKQPNPDFWVVRPKFEKKEE